MLLVYSKSLCSVEILFRENEHIVSWYPGIGIKSYNCDENETLEILDCNLLEDECTTF